MRSRKKIIIMIAVIIIGVIILGITLFVISIKKDQKEMKKIMNTIIDKYDRFEDQVLSFNEVRDNTYNIVFQEAYYDVIRDNYEKFNTAIKEEEKSVDEIEKKSKELKEYCNNYYPDAQVISKCDTFKKLYEEAVNSFVTDVAKYNEIISEYNEYIEENKDESSSLDKYKTDKKYIDYNKDKKYNGKE